MLPAGHAVYFRNLLMLEYTDVSNFTLIKELFLKAFFLSPSRYSRFVC